jgi:hypothetical protein
LEKVPPCTPFKNFRKKRKGNNFKETDRRLAQAIQLAFAAASG